MTLANMTLSGNRKLARPYNAQSEPQTGKQGFRNFTHHERSGTLATVGEPIL